ncbi:hypothetical protein GGX14DRAFT_696843 [Mycena pura]|uniref:DUF6534 domain-containing protein n=1 Tax=Mycena pura TaxID=153505 RepID=A0AAD6VI89_9AGAR|nr:hypothetical protein GGX14DRAFT_696843 [Mycena pura]
MEAFDADSTLGAFQIGALVSSILFGVTTTQAYIYYNRFPEDSPLIKATVAFTWSCEAGHLICVAHTLYTFTITDYGHPERLLERPPRSLIFFIFLTITIAVCVQVFFSYRIYILSKRLIIPCLTWVLSFVRSLCGITTLVAGLKADNLASFLAQWEWLAITTWALSAAEDVTITTSLVYLLYNQRNRGHKRTVALVDKIILWTMETGLMTTTFSIVTLICFHAMQSNFIWVGLFVVEARVFANSLFASLNSRSVLRDISESMQGQHLSFPAGGQRSQHAEPSVELLKTTISTRRTELEPPDMLKPNAI